MMLPKLYSRTANGNIQEWEIFYGGDTYWTVEGIQGGKLTTSLPTLCKPKNEGRANATTAAQQAEKEAKAKWKKKIESGYFENISDIDKETFTEPMLAKKYEDEFDGKFPVWSQSKLDGARSVIKKSGMFSRTGKKFYSAPHILEALQPFFEMYPESILDGEIYCDKLSNDFNKIISLAKKSKPTEDDLAESKATLQYHCYDYISEGQLNFSERFTLLQNRLKELKISEIYIVPVKTQQCFTQEELDTLYGEYLAQGYEGQMLRLDKPYEHKRSKNLLKRKTFQDEEFKVIEVIEGLGNKAGMAASMKVAFLDKPEKTFDSNVKGTHQYVRELWQDRANLIGKLVTVKFFNYTPDGVPRFPYVIGIRDFE